MSRSGGQESDGEDGPLGGETVSLEQPCPAPQELVDPTRDSPTRLGRRGTDRTDRSKADELGEVGYGFKEGTALGTATVDVLGWASRDMKAGPAGRALVVGHRAPFGWFHW